MGTPLKSIYKKIEKCLPKDNKFKKVSEEYFEKELNVKEGEAYILALCVSKSFRGRGISNLLLKNVLDIHMGKKVSLEVLASNTTAIDLYKKYNFKTKSEQDGFSVEELDKPKCYIMVRDAE